jgi:spore maturation protein CgeB
MNVLYAYSKIGAEAEFWREAISSASTSDTQFIPFNYYEYIKYINTSRAQLIDNLHYEHNYWLGSLYCETSKVIQESKATVLIADNGVPFHPEYLRTLPVYKVLRTSDGPLTAYDRDFAYLHAYDLVLYHSPAYSRELDMQSKLRYCGAKACEWWPLAAFMDCPNHGLSESGLFSAERQVEVAFVGALWTNKLPWLVAAKHAFGMRFRVFGLAGWKKKLYFAWKSRRPCWVMALGDREYTNLYLRCKIGINVHNRGKYGVGNCRLFDLPANGVLQLSDGDEYLDRFYRVGEEVVSFGTPEDLVEKIRFFLEHDVERQRIARAGFRRTMKDHLMLTRMNQLAGILHRHVSRAAG